MTKLSEEIITVKVEICKRTWEGPRKVKAKGDIKTILEAGWEEIQWLLGKKTRKEEGRFGSVREFKTGAEYPEEVHKVLEQLDKGKIDELYEKFKDSKNRKVIDTFAKTTKRYWYIYSVLGGWYGGVDSEMKKTWVGALERYVKDIAKSVEWLEKQKP
jgi:hypothetical protein